MHMVTVVFGITLLVLIGIAVVLSLVVLVLYEVRWIVRNSREVVRRERPPCPFSSGASQPTQGIMDEYWRN